MARAGVLEETETETESDSFMVAAKAMEIKKQLERLVKAIVDEDDYRVETADEAIRALSSLKGLKLKKSLSFKLDGHGNLLDVPEDFRCPISGELMKDPVVLATGQTYDRPFIQRWLNEGNRTCPQTKEHGMELPKPVQDIDEEVVTNADRGYLNSLLQKMSSSLSDQKEAAKELRLLTKRSSPFRALFGESIETIPQLLSPLSPGQADTDPDLQEDLITTLLNLSIHDNNKRLVAEHPLVIPLLIESLISGTIQTKSNAAATFFTLAAIDSNKIIIGTSGALNPLIALLDEGHPLAMKDVASAIFSLCSVLENKGRAINAGAVRVILQKIMDRVLVAELLAILAMLSSHQKAVQEMCELGTVSCLFGIIRESDCEHNKENCIAILYTICFADRTKLKEIKEEEMANGTVSRLARTGTSRAKRKASGILDRLNKTGSITHTA
ncbi:U-box domain-containing protein 9-like isoform X2 [Prunus avium]|uniref:RING-type E3 ubiquitin transferase n=1 Tax=Prunus avium TaxID=42229 RepID=A0A6P5RDA3_PRUAV|nr:U-box domain-containing protein 9-like isoform X2 [Prunus avium]